MLVGCCWCVVLVMGCCWGVGGGGVLTLEC